MTIPKFLLQLWAGVKTLFNSMPAELQTAAHIAVTLVENLKTIINNPAIDILTAIIPGEADDIVIACLRNSIPAILVNLKLAQNGSNTDILSEAVDTIGTLKGDVKSAFLHDLGILIAQETARAKNGELKWADAVYIIEWYYQHRYKPA